MSTTPLADARAAGLSVQVVEMGDWSPLVLVSEYDRARRAIRINAAVLRRVKAERDDAEAAAFLAAAVGHELYHHEVAEGRLARAQDRVTAECEANRFAHSRYRVDAERFERALR